MTTTIATYYHTYGVFRFPIKEQGEENRTPAVTAVSAHTWSHFRHLLATKISAVDRLVVSPELITVAGEMFDGYRYRIKRLVEERVGELLRFSQRYPETIFLLGTPTFRHDHKPKNSVVFVQSGKVLGQTNKRSSATEWERTAFELVAEEPAVLVPQQGTIGVLICADLATTSIHRLCHSEEVLRECGRGNMIGVNPTFIHPSAKILIVTSCWGVGGNKRLGAGVPNPTAYYQAQLGAISRRVLTYYPNLEKIIVVDRAPNNRQTPINGVFEKAG